MKPAYIILRMEKHKSIASLTNSHLSADRRAQHIDTSRTQLNTVLKGTFIVDDVKERLGNSKARSRHDSVLLNEFLIAASPGRLTNDPKNIETQQFFRDSLQFFENTYGKANIVYACVQFDEGNPHMHLGLVPVHGKTIKTGRGGKGVKEVVGLDSKHFFGSPAKLRKLQSEFARQVGPSFNLRRGIEGSEAKHDSIHKFYGLVNQVDEATTAIEQEFKPIYVEDILQNITLTPSGMIPMNQVKQALEREIQQINVAKHSLAQYHSSQLAKTGLDALNAAGGKIVTADQQELQDLKAHLRDKHDIAYDHPSNQTVNLADQRQDKLDRSLYAALTHCGSMTKLRDRLERKGITFEEDRQQKTVKFLVDSKPTHSKQFNYHNIRDKIGKTAHFGMDHQFAKAISTWKEGQLTDQRFIDAVKSTGLGITLLNDKTMTTTLQDHTQIGLTLQDDTDKWKKIQPFSISEMRAEIEQEQKQKKQQEPEPERKTRKYTPS